MEIPNFDKIWDLEVTLTVVAKDTIPRIFCIGDQKYGFYFYKLIRFLNSFKMILKILVKNTSDRKIFRCSFLGSKRGFIKKKLFDLRMTLKVMTEVESKVTVRNPKNKVFPLYGFLFALLFEINYLPGTVETACIWLRNFSFIPFTLSVIFASICGTTR